MAKWQWDSIQMAARIMLHDIYNVVNKGFFLHPLLHHYDVIWEKARNAYDI